MRLPLQELAISPSLPPFEQEEPRPRKGRRRLLGPLGFSALLHLVALAVAIQVVVDPSAAEKPRSAIVDVGAFVEMADAQDCDPMEEFCLDEDPTPVMPEEVLLPSEVDVPTEAREDELPELPMDVALVDEPLQIIDVPLNAARKPRPEPAPVVPAPVVKEAPKPVPTPKRVVARPTTRPTAKRRAAGPRLKVQSRPNVLSYYPAEARRRGIEGRTLVLIEVDTRGIVIDARVLESSGSRLLDRAAVRYLYDMRFRPGAGGKIKAPVNFRLR